MGNPENLDLNCIPGNKGQFFRALHGRFLKFVQVLNLSETTHFTFKDVLYSNAYAIHQEVDHEISLTYGTVSASTSLMFALACDAEFFGDGQEKYRQPENIAEIRAYCGSLLKSDNLLAYPHDLLENPLQDQWLRYFPKDTRRKKVALGLADAAIEFMLLHEVGHVCKGHVGYERSHSGKSRHVKREVGTSPVQVERPVRRVMEWEADSAAARWLAYLLHRNKMLLHDVSVTFPDPLQRMESILFAIMLAFRSIPDWNHPSVEQKANDYPHSRLRLLRIVSLITNDLESFGDSLIRTALDRASHSVKRLEDMLGINIGNFPILSDNELLDVIRSEEPDIRECVPIFDPYKLRFRLSGGARLP